MPHNRYFLDEPLQENSIVTLTDAEYHHLSRVLRARIGDRVEIVNGRGQLAKADLIELKKQKATLHLVHLIEEGDHQKVPCILAQALTQMNSLEWIIEKGTELGVAAFWLFPGIGSEKKELSQKQLERLNHLSIAAMKQCGRLNLPKIEFKPPLLKWPSLPGTLLFGDTRDHTPYLWDLPFSSSFSPPVVLLIGPESGLHSKESDFLQNSLKAEGIRLHPNILRAETASLTALSLIQQYL
jgi:16S rRNA (uracil1498-N3)-methyltransferase